MNEGTQAPLSLEIDVEELDAMRRAGRNVTVLDVREPWEVEICAIAGSINIPLGLLPQSVGRLPADVPLVVLCHHGMRSMQAVAWLRRQGLDNAVNLRGGIDAWARRIDLNMATY
ncbi:MAG TPA: rhodanese-like domain-containing protein [Alphaproteobacteria bacterium]